MAEKDYLCGQKDDFLCRILVYKMTELSQLYKEYYHQEPARVQLLGGAASNRRYFRLFHNLAPDSEAVIGVIGENAKENHAFLALGRHMYDQGLPVPQILISSSDEMRYLQQDLGKRSLYDLITVASRSDDPETRTQLVGLLHQVMCDLPRLQFMTGKGFDFETDAFREPRFCSTTVHWDLNYFKYCFLKPSGYPMDELKLEADFDRLSQALLDCTSPDEKWCFLYRDFQSRNVMIHDGRPWYIDFQGGYEGPVYYDVASFLWQTRAGYAPELRNELLQCYVDGLQQFCHMSMRVFRHRLRVFVFFRLLQTLGTYGYRGLFEHKAMFQTPIHQALCALVNITRPDSEPALSDCSLRGVAGDDSPAIDHFEIEDDCPYICQLLVDVARMERFQPMPATGPLTVRITSFSYKKGIPEDLSGNGGGFVFDCRAPLNPGRFAFYRSFTGLDDVVIDFLEGRRNERGEVIPPSERASGPTSMQTFVQNVYRLVDPAVETYLKRGFTSLVINCGCTGGQHRSVYCAQHVAEHIRERFPSAHVVLTHREQTIKT